LLAVNDAVVKRKPTEEAIANYDQAAKDYHDALTILLGHLSEMQQQTQEVRDEADRTIRHLILN
jgi:prefoldin subunit 5